MKPLSLLSRRATLLAALGAASIPAFADSASLEGRRFKGVFLERGKTSGDADTLTFQGGRFRSSACDRFGYSDAPYTMSVQGDEVRFEAETESPKYGKLHWKGVVRGDKLDATATMLRSGKPPVENWIVAGAAK
ncbi:MAG: hypothetical protein WA210_01180 [Burkholderiaceae bacterium]